MAQRPAFLRLSLLLPLLAAAGVLTLAIVHILRGLPAAPEAEPVLVLRPTSFERLPGWNADDHAAALPAFLRSCERLLAQPPGRALNGAREPLNPQDPGADRPAVAGTISDWQAVCDEAATLEPSAAKAFFERAFQPVAVLNEGEATGLFTGYYEPVMQARRTPEPPYTAAILQRPDDLVMVDLGAFREDLRGRRIAGRVDAGRLFPYEDRAELVAKEETLAPLAIAYGDPIDVFFLQIQGSGRLELPDGTTLRVGYAAQNGHPYTPIGRPMIQQGLIPRERISMQSIRDWLEANPERANEIMNLNASYVFFRELSIEDPGLGPLGAQGVSLTPERSLAVDHTRHAYGVPVWLDAEQTPEDPQADPTAFRRLMIAQDTGGAIRGPVRGDVFFGSGEEAAAAAGPMKGTGRMWLLLPKPLAARLGSEWREDVGAVAPEGGVAP